MRTSRALSSALLFLALFEASASAAPNDFRLNARRDGVGVLFNEGGQITDRWERLTTELGYVLAPRLASPAETLGHAGFGLGFMWTGTFVDADEPFWYVTEAGQKGSPNGLLHTLQLDLRKGLPFSLELGVSLVWLVESEIFAPGLELRWAIHEGFDATPDFALRGSVNHMVGARDLNLTVVGLDAVISKGFGIGGMVHLAPYLSWSLLFIGASSRVIDPTPTIDLDVGQNFVFEEQVASSNLHHKLTLGARALFSILALEVQGEFEMLKKNPSGTSFFGSVASLSVKLGVEF